MLFNAMAVISGSIGLVRQASVSEPSVPSVTFDMGYLSIDDSTEDGACETEMDAEQSVFIDLPFTEPTPVLENSLQDQPTPEVHIPDHPVRFEVIPKGSQKGKDLMVDSLRYTYVVKEHRTKSTTWRCSVRSLACAAGVTQKDDDFKFNTKVHIHAPEPERGLTAKVTSKAKQVAANDLLRSAPVIEAKSDVNGLVGVGAVNDRYVARRVNRAREKARPEEPTDMNFELNKDAMPADFYRREVKVGELSLRRLQRKTYRSMQSALFTAWDSYRAGELTATGLLKTVSTFFKPRVCRPDSN